ncbi:MAG: hypothetical protein WAN48_11415 [Actinomycetes bacterium]
MLLDAAQDRLNAAAKLRLVEGYVTTRDGYVSGRVAAGASKVKSGGTSVPTYARSKPGPRDAAAQQATLGRLAAMFPESVTVH